ncbi:MAG: hypothetical protein OXC92_04890, partial [Flavobacteriaceae bacterium]|nr:hypothetical protein [Flavobacteriaceae bacterium]
ISPSHPIFFDFALFKGLCSYLLYGFCFDEGPEYQINKILRRPQILTALKRVQVSVVQYKSKTVFIPLKQDEVQELMYQTLE